MGEYIIHEKMTLTVFQADLEVVQFELALSL